MEQKKLHFLRLRKKDSAEPFCDPFSDIKVVVQQAFKELPILYREICDDPQKVDYLKAYLKVFVTRLEEDPTPLVQQLDDFYLAMADKFTKAELLFFERMLGVYILHAFALYQRRDGAVDAKERGAFRSVSAALAMKQQLSKETFEKVMEEVKGAKEVLNKFESSVTAVDALCVEDEAKTVKNIKDLVAWDMEPGASWNEVAEACNTYVSKAEDVSDKTIAASLAYPDYKSPYFEIEVESESGKDTTET